PCAMDARNKSGQNGRWMVLARRVGGHRRPERVGGAVEGLAAGRDILLLGGLDVAGGERRVVVGLVGHGGGVSLARAGVGGVLGLLLLLRLVLRPGPIAEQGRRLLQEAA